MLTEQGRTAEAYDLLQTWAQTQPYLPEPHLELAALQQKTGDLTGAEQSLRQALAVNPQHPQATAHLANVYQQTGRVADAAQLYQRSLAANPYQPAVQAHLAELQMPNGASPAVRMSQTMPMHDETLAKPPYPYLAQRVPTASPMMGPGQAYGAPSQTFAIPAQPQMAPTPMYATPAGPAGVPTMTAPAPMMPQGPAVAPTPAARCRSPCRLLERRNRSNSALRFR